MLPIISLANIDYARAQDGSTTALVRFSVTPPGLEIPVIHDFEIDVQVAAGADPTAVVNEAKVELHKLVLQMFEQTKAWAT